MSGSTSFSTTQDLLPCPFVHPNDPEEVATRMSLAPPTLYFQVSEFTKCMRRAGHTALIGFSDPTFVQCNNDATSRFRAYRHWGEGGSRKGDRNNNSTVPIVAEQLETPTRPTAIGLTSSSASHKSTTTRSKGHASTNTYTTDFSKNVGPFDKDVRFVLWERRHTEDPSRTPWQPKPAYLEVLRKQGRLPEQAEDALTAINAGAWKLEANR